MWLVFVAAWKSLCGVNEGRRVNNIKAPQVGRTGQQSRAHRQAHSVSTDLRSKYASNIDQHTRQTHRLVSTAFLLLRAGLLLEPVVIGFLCCGW